MLQINKHATNIVKANITSMYTNVDEIEKGGEGSRGGKVIGHTKSGKPVYKGKLVKDEFGKYKSSEVQDDRDYTPEDHQDASRIHDEVSERALHHNDFGNSQQVENRFQHHDELSKYHKEKSK